MEYFVLFADGTTIGRINRICNCDKCKERGQIEIFIDDLKGHYLDCITFNDLMDPQKVISIGPILKLEENSQSREKFYRMLCCIINDFLVNATS